MLPDSPTKTSQVLSSGRERNAAEVSQAALTQLCETYRGPIYAYLRQKGYREADADDLTQDFFVKLLKGNLLDLADPSRGRFRSLLLTSLQHFLVNAATRREARKRGGGMEFVAFDAGENGKAAPGAWPAEKVFDARWAATVVEVAERRLREECVARGRGDVYEALHESLAADRETVNHEESARLLGVSTTAVKTLLHRLRVRFRALLREEVAQTVAGPAEIENEVRYLCEVLGELAA